MDFCLNMYRSICRILKDLNTITVEEYLLGSAREPFVILRHDVDRQLSNALAMAETEHSFGIRSTYYFRYPHTFQVQIISRIHQLGHEVGYHYEVLDKTQGDCAQALELFRQELEIFRSHFPVTTVCMHGNPLTSWDGRSIWNGTPFSAFSLLGEAYISIKDPLTYLTDTGRNWNNRHNVKDSFSLSDRQPEIRHTRHLIEVLQNKQFDNLYLNFHPERWGPGIWGWARAFVRDSTFNMIKTALQLMGRINCLL